QNRPLHDARDFILRHLGEGFARRFMLPYNEKLFTVPCEELSPEWGGRFIPRPSLADVVRGALGFSRDDAGYNATFWYPREGGIESLARGLLRDLAGADVRVSSRVESIDGRRARLATGEEPPVERRGVAIPPPANGRVVPRAPPPAAQAAS